MTKTNRVMVSPRPFIVAAMTMGEVIRGLDQDERDGYDKMSGRKPGEMEWLGCFVLPSFQRPPVWTKEQNVRFLESVWLGYDIGRYTVVQNDTKWEDCLIDGQQRIRAILSYVNDEFPVKGENGKDYLYSEITDVDRRFFNNMVFPRAVIREKYSEKELRDIYNRLNYGGTPHTEDQRA